VEKVKPNVFMENTLSFITYRASQRNIEIQQEFSKVNMWIEADVNQMQQVFFNILINAIEAIHGSGIIKVSTYYEPGDSPDTSYCVIAIKDTGIGIAMEYLPKIFEPYFTTKGRKGTGIGLSMTQLIVSNHKGKLSIESETGEGTTVIVKLPAWKEE
jgi:two-component system NtrC family sensor kinase